MKKLIFVGLMLAILLPGFGSVAMAAQYSKRYIQFVDERGEPRTDLSYVKVFDGGTVTASTIKAESSGDTAVTNPMTLTSTATGLRPKNGTCQFYTTKSTVDILAHVGGREVSFKKVNASDTYYMIPRITRRDALAGTKGIYDNFLSWPVNSSKVAVGGVATGTEADKNLCNTGRNIFEYNIIGTCNTTLGPTRVATGLSVGLDVANNEGIELYPGALAGCAGSFTVGTDGPFHFKLRFSIADVSGSDEIKVGFRKLEACQLVPDNYNDMAAMTVVSGTITTDTILSNAATVTVSTTNTWADAAIKTLEVYVSQAGVVTFKIDGAAPTVTQVFSFPAGTVVIPFFYNRYDTTTPGVIVLEEWDCSLDD